MRGGPGGTAHAEAAGGVAPTVFEKPRGLPLTLLFTLWVVLLFDPQWLLASKGLTPLLKLPVALFGGLLLTLVFAIPSDPVWKRRWQWYGPFALFIATGVVTLPFAFNNGMARESLMQLALYWTLIVATVSLVDSVRRAEQLLTLYGIQFLWWGIWGAQTGLVGWHVALGNYDGFGAFAVGGIGICYFFGMSSSKRWFRIAMTVSAGLCALGVVAAHARGAFLAALALFAVIWLRSPRKGRTLAAGLGAGVIMSIAASVLFEEGYFLNEMMSVFEEGTDEGTGSDRWELWMAAVEVWKERPLLGVGPRNFGVFAAATFEPGDIGGMYSANPGMLYNRSTHSMYFQTLSEHGLIGTLALGWMVVDFWKRNRMLRTEGAGQRWRALGGQLQLRTVALGLEACMVAFLVTAAFYALTGIHWFYTLLGLNLLLYSLVGRGPAGSGRGRLVRGPGRSEPANAHELDMIPALLGMTLEQDSRALSSGPSDRPAVDPAG